MEKKLTGSRTQAFNSRINSFPVIVSPEIFFVFTIIFTARREEETEWNGHYSWFRHYATSRKVAGSILDEVIGFFN
jgi:hypothetical protein